MALLLSPPMPSRALFSSLPKPNCSKPLELARTSSSSSSASVTSPFPAENRRLPVLLFDVMDTLVRDPFYHDVPAFFGMEFQELIKEKHPTAWLEFENGLINERMSVLLICSECTCRLKVELAKKFFKDGRLVDIEGLKECMTNGYHYLDGIEALLHTLKQKNYEIHAFTNYPIWYRMIEDKLKLSTYLTWSFCSCNIGKRKPAHDLFLEVSRHLGVEPANCIFIDDRMANVEAARNAGMISLQFKNTPSLRQDLSMLGIEIHDLSET